MALDLDTWAFRWGMGQIVGLVIRRRHALVFGWLVSFACLFCLRGVWLWVVVEGIARWIGGGGRGVK